MFVVKDGQVLLIRKKTGFGKGKINGPGGKLDAGETAMEAAVRETHEELCILVRKPEFRGTLSFDFTDGMRMHVSVFHATEFEGEPIETEEALPLWFEISDIPFNEMWADDELWLGRMLDGDEQFEGKFDFDGQKMLSSHLTWHSKRL